MDKQEVFEEFGKALIEDVRDYSIDGWQYLLDDESFMERHQISRESLTEQQLEFLRIFEIFTVDTVLHNLLLMFENSDWIKLRLEASDTLIEDIRQVASGDLQGYIYIWAENYSKEPLSHEPLE